MKRLLFPFVLLAGLFHAFAAPPELGTIAWGRDLDVALSVSKGLGKPVFLLFQEVPG